MANQVTLTFAGDSSKLESAFKNVGSAADGMKSKVESTSESVRHSGEAYDSAAEAADNVDTKAMGFRDTLTGVQDTMGGVSQIAKGDLFNGFFTLGAGIGDLGSGFANFLIPAIKNFSKASITAAASTARQTAATVASKAAQLAVSAATKAWAAAQWLINAALSANPIGLVIVAVAALVAGIIYAYKHSEKFRTIVQGALKAVLAVAQTVGGWFKNTLWPWLRDVFSRAGSAAVGLKNGIVSAFNAVVGWLKSFPGKVKGYFDTAVRGAGVILTWAKALPGKIAGYFSGIARVITSPFSAAFNGVRDLWNNTIGGKGLSIPGWVPKLGGKSFTIPRFHSGGIVPGSAGSETLAVLKAGERVTSGSNQPDAQQSGPIYLEAHIDLGNDVTRVVQVQFREQNRALKRAVMAGAR